MVLNDPEGFFYHNSIIGLVPEHEIHGMTTQDHECNVNISSNLEIIIVHVDDIISFIFLRFCNALKQILNWKLDKMYLFKNIVFRIHYLITFSNFNSDTSWTAWKVLNWSNIRIIFIVTSIFNCKNPLVPKFSERSLQKFFTWKWWTDFFFYLVFLLIHTTWNFKDIISRTRFINWYCYYNTKYLV